MQLWSYETEYLVLDSNLSITVVPSRLNTLHAM